jgi:general secretion pathway protein K
MVKNSLNSLAENFRKDLKRLIERCKHERGMALLATMMAIALMTIIVVDFTSSSALGYLSAANNANEIRATYLARSAVNVGLALIAQDTRAQQAQQQSGTTGTTGAAGTTTQGSSSAPTTTQQGSSSTTGQGQPFDSFASVWALPFPPMPVNGGTISVSVVDEARKFNINKLVNQPPTTYALASPTPNGSSTPTTTPATPVPGTTTGTSSSAANPNSVIGQPNMTAVTQFTSLLLMLGLNPDIVPALVDWLDPDSIESQGGAEADYYLKLTPPYQPRNGPMPTIGDLRLVKGVDDATFAMLRNFVTVEPEVGVNPNTASAQVLTSLEPGLTQNPDLVKTIIEAREVRPFTVVTDVTNLPGVGAVTNLSSDLTVRGQYFTITGVGNYAGARKLVFATFLRNTDGTGTLSSWQED